MPAASSFDYAVLRVVPRVERGEFVNVGAVVYCRTRGYLEARICLNRSRLTAFAPELDISAVEERLELIRLCCAGAPEAGPIGQLSQADRFHWLVAPRSTVVQPSPVHTGVCDDPAAALQHIVEAMVCPPDEGISRPPAET